jgi:hypothetical protein
MIHNESRKYTQNFPLSVLHLFLEAGGAYIYMYLQLQETLLPDSLYETNLQVVKPSNQTNQPANQPKFSVVCCDAVLLRGERESRLRDGWK